MTNARRDTFRRLTRLALLGLVIVLIGTALQPTAAQQSDTFQLVIWWPDALAPAEARTTFADEFARYQEFTGVTLEVRYRVYTEGDYVRQLRLTNSVAPDALPDLTLMHRRDLLDAARQDLIVPLAEWLPGTSLNLPDNQRLLGTVEGQLYGLPYLLQIRHMVYAPEHIAQAPLTLDDIIQHQVPLLFPAAVSEGRSINGFLLSQYIAAGGTFTNDEGAPSLDEGIILDLLTFYEQALSDELIATCLIDNENCLLNYDNPGDYWTVLGEDSPVLALMNSDLFLTRRHTRYADLNVAPIPTLDGEQTATLDGWLWVLVTNDSIRQREAQRFIQSMLATDQHALIASEVDMLPSQDGALRLLADSDQLERFQTLVQAAFFVPEEEQRGAAAVALQTAFEQVLRGTAATEATQSALDSLSQ